MWRKKLMAAAAAGMTLAALAAFPALAHGHCSRQASVSVSGTASLTCTVEGCSETGYHTHDGHDYWGCYPVCTAEGCSEAGYHTHNGDGCWGYYPVCTVEGCSETGIHTHDSGSYCGYSHSSGYCDNSCSTSSVTTRSSGRHHGCH